jgi:hypothetical protein
MIMRYHIGLGVGHTVAHGGPAVELVAEETQGIDQDSDNQLDPDFDRSSGSDGESEDVGPVEDGTHDSESDEEFYLAYGED